MSIAILFSAYSRLAQQDRKMSASNKSCEKIFRIVLFFAWQDDNEKGNDLKIFMKRDLYLLISHQIYYNFRCFFRNWGVRKFMRDQAPHQCDAKNDKDNPGNAIDNMNIVWI